MCVPRCHARTPHRCVPQCRGLTSAHLGCLIAAFLQRSLGVPWAGFARIERQLWPFVPDLSPARQLQLSAGRTEFWANGRVPQPLCGTSSPVSAWLPLVRVPQVPHICKLFCVCLVHPEHAGVIVQPTQATLDMPVSASKPFCICKVVSILCFKPCDHNDVGHNSSCIKPIFSDTHFSFYQPLVREIHNSYIDGVFFTFASYDTSVICSENKNCVRIFQC